MRFKRKDTQVLVEGWRRLINESKDDAIGHLDVPNLCPFRDAVIINVGESLDSSKISGQSKGRIGDSDKKKYIEEFKKAASSSPEIVDLVSPDVSKDMMIMDIDGYDGGKDCLIYCTAGEFNISGKGTGKVWFYVPKGEKIRQELGKKNYDFGQLDLNKVLAAKERKSRDQEEEDLRGEDIKNRMDQERGGKAEEDYIDDSGEIKSFDRQGLAKDAQGRTVYQSRGKFDLNDMNRKPVKYF